jgi:hypothetical protein
MRGPADVIHPLAHRRAAAPSREPLIALIVIGVSLRTGYGAGRVWPLPMSSLLSPHSAGMIPIPERKDALSPESSPPASGPSPLFSPLATTPSLSAAIVHAEFKDAVRSRTRRAGGPRDSIEARLSRNRRRDLRAGWTHDGSQHARHAPGMRAESPCRDRPPRSLPQILSRTSPPETSWPIVRETEILSSPCLPRGATSGHSRPFPSQMLAGS